MNREYTRWTFVEITRLRKMIEEGKSREHIASILGMPVQRVIERIRHENRSPEQKRAKYELAKALREKDKDLNKRRAIRTVTPHPVLAVSRPSPEMIADAQRRADAKRSLTAEFFGDPPKGWSALDRRQA
jgi:hypothetical protein